jgi:predicted NBD/HSP70 family sugar kinase
MKKNILAIDIGGTNVKVQLSSGDEIIKIASGPQMTPRKMVDSVRQATSPWKYDVISIGYPGVVTHNQITTEPHNLAQGWVGFDFKKAFGVPVKIVNDAAMQALGSDEGKRMLFLGLGTGLGSAMVIEGILQPMELAHLPYRKGCSYEGYLGKAGLERLGKKKWREHVAKIVKQLQDALLADYVVLGGGNARLIKELPPHTRLGSNNNAFLGTYRLWG